jgi:hypothetical protein
MRNIWMAIVLAGCTEQQLASQDQAATAAVFHEVFQGGAATAQLIDQGISVTVNVIDNRVGPSHELYLYYEYTVGDPSTQTCNGTYCTYSRYISDYGWGYVPEGDANVSPATARVHTTTGPSFNTLHCVSEVGSTCEPGTGGTVDLSWERTGTARYFTSGINRTVTGPYTLQTQGTSWSSHARATGTILGHDLTAFGTLDESNQGTITKDLFVADQP